MERPGCSEAAVTHPGLPGWGAGGLSALCRAREPRPLAAPRHPPAKRMGPAARASSALGSVKNEASLLLRVPSPYEGVFCAESTGFNHSSRLSLGEAARRLQSIGLIGLFCCLLSGLISLPLCSHLSVSDPVSDSKPADAHAPEIKGPSTVAPVIRGDAVQDLRV